MNLQQKIETEILNKLAVKKLILENESHQHSGNAPESHFKMILVSDDFDGLSKVKRHQMVYKVLNDLMPLFHALALHTFTTAEWTVNINNLDSPVCSGGSAT